MTITITKIAQEEKQGSTQLNIKDDLQVMWDTIKLIQMCQRASLPEMKENSKLIRLEDKIIRMELIKCQGKKRNGYNRYKQHNVCSSTTVALRRNEPGRKGTNGRKKERLLKNKKQRQTLNKWRKTRQYLLKREQALVMESVTGRRGRFFKNIK